MSTRYGAETLDPFNPTPIRDLPPSRMTDRHNPTNQIMIEPLIRPSDTPDSTPGTIMDLVHGLRQKWTANNVYCTVSLLLLGISVAACRCVSNVVCCMQCTLAHNHRTCLHAEKRLCMCFKFGMWTASRVQSSFVLSYGYNQRWFI